jgi:hypothetical protein
MTPWQEMNLTPEDAFNRATNSIGRISIELRLWRARHRRSHPGPHERR